LIIALIYGMSLGFVDNIAQILLLRSFSNLSTSVSAYMQALHSLYGVGCLAAPLLVAPFLNSIQHLDAVNGESNDTQLHQKWHYAYYISALIMMPNVLLFIYFAQREEWHEKKQIITEIELSNNDSELYKQIQQRQEDELQSRRQSEEWHAQDKAKQQNQQISDSPSTAATASTKRDSNSSSATSTITNHNPDEDISPLASPYTAAQHLSTKLIAEETNEQRKFRIKIIGCVTLFLVLYVGCETGMGSYIFSYAVHKLPQSFSEKQAALLNSVFWTAFAAGRVVAIPISLYLSVDRMILIDLIGSITALILLLLFSESASILWLSSVLFGFFCASVYPSIIAWTEEKTTVSGKVMSLLAVSAASGDAIVPAIMGYFLSHPRSDGTSAAIGMMQCALITALLSFGVFVFLLLVIVPSSPSAVSSAADSAIATQQARTRRLSTLHDIQFSQISPEGEELYNMSPDSLSPNAIQNAIIDTDATSTAAAQSHTSNETSISNVMQSKPSQDETQMMHNAQTPQTDQSKTFQSQSNDTQIHLFATQAAHHLRQQQQQQQQL
jgi:fucose permease